MRKGISIIIPTYNREKFVAEAIQSVLNQEYEGHLEIIVSDDGSSDNTLEIIQTFKNKVTLLRKPFDCNTQGAASTRNRGIKASTQPLICFLDSDDLYLPGHLRIMAPLFEKEPKIGFAFCRSLEFKIENGRKLFKPWTRNRIFKNDIKNPVISRSRIVNTNSFIFRRDVFDRVGFFNEKYTNGEDGDMWMRISEQFKGKFADHFGAAYRVNHEINQLTSNAKDKVNQCALLLFEDCRKRYFDLKLRDSNRIFKIKLTLLRLKYPAIYKSKRNYHFKYAILILQHPTAYFQKMIEDYYMKKEAPKTKRWDKIEKYVN